MKGKHLEEDLYEFVTGRASEEDARHAEEHLEGCEKCREEYKAMRRTLSVIDKYEPPPLPMGFKKRVVRRIYESPSPRKPLLRAMREWFQVPRFRWSLQGAALALVILLTVTVYRATTLHVEKEDQGSSKAEMRGHGPPTDMPKGSIPPAVRQMGPLSGVNKSTEKETRGGPEAEMRGYGSFAEMPKESTAPTVPHVAPHSEVGSGEQQKEVQAGSEAEAGGHGPAMGTTPARPMTARPGMMTGSPNIAPPPMMPRTHMSATHRVTVAEEQKAVGRYREERARFARSVGPFKFGPEHRAVLIHLNIRPGTYYYRRDAFYRVYDWGPLAYVYRLYPRYGLYDVVFLAFMLDHIAEQQYALMCYNHMNETAFVQWRHDMDRLAIENADLRTRLAAMDRQVAGLQGRPVDPSYVPADAQDIVLSPDVIDGFAASIESYQAG